MKFRSILYALAKALGDLSSVKSGRVGRRVVRRAAGRVTGKGLGRWL